MKIQPTLILLFVFVISFVSIDASAQSKQQQKVDSVFKQFKHYFNNHQADSIYLLTGERFRAQVNQAQFQNIAVQQLFPQGHISQSSFINFLNNSIGVYRLKFDKVTLQLSLSLDDADKVALFLFEPYKDAAELKPYPVPSSNKMFTQTDVIVDSVAKTYIQKVNTVGLSIAVINNGQTSTYQYGETQKANHKFPDNGTLYELGSITKTFTATLLAYYVNQGKIKLTDPITKYLPDSVAANPELQQVTLLSLSNHTSGLPGLPPDFEKYIKDEQNPYADYKKSDLYEYLKTCQLKSKPGESYAYSNMAVGLLGVILERISGKTFDQMVTEILCKPLAMADTRQHLSAANMAHLTTVYNESGDATPVWSFDALASAGALRSDMGDMLKYLKANMYPQPNELGKAIQLTHRVTYNKGGVKVGLGWHIISIHGVNYYFHNGGTYGSSTYMAFNTEKNLAVIVLANSAESTDPVAVGILQKLQ